MFQEISEFSNFDVQILGYLKMIQIQLLFSY